MMQVLAYASVKGDGVVNEDTAGTAGRLAWIFDGATATGPQTIPGAASDAEWLVHRMDTAIRHETSQHSSGTPLTDLAAHLIGDVRRGLTDLGLPADQHTPYASGALLRAGPGWVDYLVLGDVTLTLRCGKRSQVITDPRVADLAQDAIDLASRYQGEQLRHKQQDFERRYVNQPGGYWVFGGNPEAATQALTGRFPLDEPALALLATDGFGRVVDVFELAPSWPALAGALASAGHQSIAAAIAELRAAESDPRHAEVARIKQSDDATALLLRIEERP